MSVVSIQLDGPIYQAAHVVRLTVLPGGTEKTYTRQSAGPGLRHMERINAFLDEHALSPWVTNAEVAWPLFVLTFSNDVAAEITRAEFCA